MRRQPVAVSVSHLYQRGRRARRQGQHAEASVLGLLDRCRGIPAHRRRCFLDNDVRVGSGESERTDARDAGPVRRAPTGRLLPRPAPEAGPRECAATDSGNCKCFGSSWCSSDRMTLIRPAMPDARFQMPDVRLHRPDQQRSAGVAPGTECRTGGLDFDRVAQRGAGPVRLQVIDVAGRDTGTLQRLGDYPLLGNAVRHRQTTGCAVLVHRAAPDHGPNPVTVADRVRQAASRRRRRSPPLAHSHPRPRRRSCTGRPAPACVPGRN